MKILDKAARLINKTNCTCGAWATSFPAVHSEWCDHAKLDSKLNFTELLYEMFDKKKIIIRR